MKQLTSNSFSIKDIDIMGININVEMIDSLHIISPEIYILKYIRDFTNDEKIAY